MDRETRRPDFEPYVVLFETLAWDCGVTPYATRIKILKIGNYVLYHRSGSLVIVKLILTF